MSRVPGLLKRVLLPVWNRSHRVARTCRRYIDAVVQGRIERCAVCGRVGPMLYERRVIPRRLEELWELSPRLADAFARKESCDCSWCGAKLRAQRMARVLLDEFPVEPAARSLSEWVTRPRVRSLRVAEINRIEGLHDGLAKLPNLAFSDFQPDAAAGERVAGIRSEDLTRLTYRDAAFDLILTSETLEHVPDLHQALGELYRVLTDDGVHIFTVPLLPGVPATFARARIRADGSIEALATPLFHPGGDHGYRVFTEFGADFADLLRSAGFEVEVAFGPVTEDDLAQVWITRKTRNRA